MKRTTLLILLAASLACLGARVRIPPQFASGGTAPTISSVAATATQVTFTMSIASKHTATAPTIAVTMGTDGTTPANSPTLVYASGDGSTALVYNFTRAGTTPTNTLNPTSVETATVSGATGCIQADADSTNIASFSNVAVTNNSATFSYTQQEASGGSTQSDQYEPIRYTDGVWSAGRHYSGISTTYKLTKFSVGVASAGTGPTVTGCYWADSSASPSGAATTGGTGAVTSASSEAALAFTMSGGISIVYHAYYWLGFHGTQDSNNYYKTYSGDYDSTNNIKHSAETPPSWSTGTNSQWHTITYSSP